jgi:hypothetical protein
LKPFHLIDKRSFHLTTMDCKFWNKVNKDCDGGCWEWCGGISGSGYGHFSWQGKDIYAHRCSYQLHHPTTIDLFGGGDASKLHVCHTCDNTKCVNPAHLFLGSPNDNIQDKCAKGRARGGRPAKLTDKEVLEIRAKYDKKSGNTYKALSDEYGVSSTEIAAIITRKHWRHI